MLKLEDIQKDSYVRGIQAEYRDNVIDIVCLFNGLGRQKSNKKGLNKIKLRSVKGIRIGEIFED